MAESSNDKAAGDRNTGNGSSSVRECAGLRSSSSEHSPPGESDSTITDGNPDLRILLVENCSLYLNYKEVYKTFVAFGSIERIQTKTFKNSNSFYIKFSRARDAKLAMEKLNNMKIAGKYITTKLFNHKNIVDKDEDYIPKVDFSNTNTERKDHDSLTPIYNLITVEEGHNQLKVFNHLNTLISKPKITPETFKKFGRNTYLVKVQPRQGYMLKGAFQDYEDSGIISINPYDEYNGSKGKIYNSDLAKLSKEEILNMCPPQVIDCFNITKYDEITKSRVNTPTFILKFSNQIPPDYIEIGPLRIRVKSYSATPRICTRCLEFGHSKNRCTAGKNLCVNCGEEHLQIDKERNVCGNPSKCHHCQGDDIIHKTFSNDCPEYQKQKEICNIAYNERTSFFEANKIYHQRNGLSFANAVARPNSQVQRIIYRKSTEQRTSTTVAPSSISTASTQAVSKGSSKTTSSNTVNMVTSNSKISVSSSLSKNPSSNVKLSRFKADLTPQSSTATKSSESKSSLKTPIQKLKKNSAASEDLWTSSMETQSVDLQRKQSSKKKSEKSLKSSNCSSLPDLTELEDLPSFLSSEFTSPRKTVSSKRNKDEKSVATSNRFEQLSMESVVEDSVSSHGGSIEEKVDRKRKSLDTSDDLSQPSVKMKITAAETEKHQKAGKSNKSKCQDPKPPSWKP